VAGSAVAAEVVVLDLLLAPVAGNALDIVDTVVQAEVSLVV
jgi:hypothetical protein